MNSYVATWLHVHTIRPLFGNFLFFIRKFQKEGASERVITIIHYIHYLLVPKIS